MKLKITIIVFLISTIFLLVIQNSNTINEPDISKISFEKGTPRAELENVLGKPLVKSGNQEIYFPIESGSSITYKIVYREDKVESQEIIIDACIASIPKKSLIDINWQQRVKKHRSMVKHQRVENMFMYIKKKIVEQKGQP